MFDVLVAVRGGGDLGSGVALRLVRTGFRVVILERARPLAVRRSVSFGEAVYEGGVQVEELIGRLAKAHEAREIMGAGEIPVVVDPAAEALSGLRPYALVDAILAKRNTGTTRTMAPLVVGLGPGFSAGKDVHAVIETNRGPRLGRVIWKGQAEPDTGWPGPVAGQSGSRVLRAPVSGVLRTCASIGDIVEEGATVASVAGMSIHAGFRGLVRGLARDGLEVTAGMKVGDIDPRLDPGLCTLVSDKALAVAGGVLEALLVSLRERPQ